MTKLVGWQGCVTAGTDTKGHLLAAKGDLFVSKGHLLAAKGDLLWRDDYHIGKTENHPHPAHPPHLKSMLNAQCLMLNRCQRGLLVTKN